MSGDAKVSFTGSRSTSSFHWFDPGGNKCGKATSIEAMLSAHSRLTVGSTRRSEIISWILSMLFMIEFMSSLRAAITSLVVSCARETTESAMDTTRTMTMQLAINPAQAMCCRGQDCVGARLVTVTL